MAIAGQAVYETMLADNEPVSSNKIISVIASREIHVYSTFAMASALAVDNPSSVLRTSFLSKVRCCCEWRISHIMIY
jgi:hypothetical protein